MKIHYIINKLFQRLFKTKVELAYNFIDYFIIKKMVANKKLNDGILFDIPLIRSKKYQYILPDSINNNKVFYNKSIPNNKLKKQMIVNNYISFLKIIDNPLLKKFKKPFNITNFYLKNNKLYYQDDFLNIEKFAEDSILKYLLKNVKYYFEMRAKNSGDTLVFVILNKSGEFLKSNINELIKEANKNYINTYKNIIIIKEETFINYDKKDIFKLLYINSEIKNLEYLIKLNFNINRCKLNEVYYNNKSEKYKEFINDLKLIVTPKICKRYYIDDLVKVTK